MTINKLPNQDDTLYQSGFAGWEGDFINALPSFAAVSTTGNATTALGQTGLGMVAKTTKGHTASVSVFERGFNNSSASNFSGKFITDIIYNADNTTPTNLVKLGPHTVGKDDGTYLDLTNGNCVVNGTSQSFPTAAATNAARLRIINDYDKDATTFITKGSATDDSATLSGVSKDDYSILSEESLGNNSYQRPRIKWCRVVFFP